MQYFEDIGLNYSQSVFNFTKNSILNKNNHLLM